MAKFKEAEIKTMLNMVTKNMISFSRFCELINERIIENPIQFDKKNPFDSHKELLNEHMDRIKKEREIGGKL